MKKIIAILVAVLTICACAFSASAATGISAEEKKIILDMVVSRRLNGEKIDANIVVELGKLCGKNFMDYEPLEE